MPLPVSLNVMSWRYEPVTEFFAVWRKMQAYSMDLRTRVAAACHEAGARQADVAQRFGVSVPFIKKLLRRQRETGSLAAKPATGGRVRYLDAAAQTWLVDYVQQHPDVTLAELNQAWQAQGGRPVGQTCIWQVLDEHDLRRKKKACTRLSGSGRTCRRPGAPTSNTSAPART